MLKKFILILLLLTAPVLADEINMTPQKTFSGFNNNGIRSTYPKLSRPVQYSTTDNRTDIMKPKSVREMGDITPTNDGTAPMNYGQFPRNNDSSNMLPMSEVQSGIQSMFMGE